MTLTILQNSHYTAPFLKFQIWSYSWHHIACQSKSTLLSMVIPPRLHLSSLASSPTPSMPYTPAIQTRSAVLKRSSYVAWMDLDIFSQPDSFPPHLLCLAARIYKHPPKLSSAFTSTVEFFISPDWIAWVWKSLKSPISPWSITLLCCPVTPHIYPPTVMPAPHKITTSPMFIRD